MIITNKSKSYYLYFIYIIVMVSDPLIINNNNYLNKTLKKNNRYQQLYMVILYVSLFVPIILNFVYLFVIGLRLDQFVDRINQTKLLDYLSKTESIIDFVCDNENIC